MAALSRSATLNLRSGLDDLLLSSQPACWGTGNVPDGYLNWRKRLTIVEQLVTFAAVDHPHVWYSPRCDWRY